MMEASDSSDARLSLEGNVFMAIRHPSGRWLRLGVLLAMALLVGCGSQEKVATYDEYFEDLLARVDRLSEKLESIESAQMALQEADQIGQLSTSLSQKLGQASNLPTADSLTGLQIKERYEELWEPRLKLAFERLDEAAKGVIQRTKQDDVPKRVGAQLKRLQRQIEGFRKGLREGLGEQAESVAGD